LREKKHRPTAGPRKSQRLPQVRRPADLIEAALLRRRLPFTDAPVDLRKVRRTTVVGIFDANPALITAEAAGTAPEATLPRAAASAGGAVSTARAARIPTIPVAAP
jgi:hypothetical protein